MGVGYRSSSSSSALGQCNRVGAAEKARRAHISCSFVTFEAGPAPLKAPPLPASTRRTIQ